MWIGKASSRWACRIILFAFCRLPIVGLDVLLADRDTLAHKSTRALVANHCSEPLIPRKVDSPVASSLSLPSNLCKFFGRHLQSMKLHVCNLRATDRKHGQEYTDGHQQTCMTTFIQRSTLHCASVKKKSCNLFEYYFESTQLQMEFHRFPTMQ